MESCRHLWEAFIIPSKSSKTSEPPERTLNHPATRQQHEAHFCFFKFHDKKSNTIILSAPCSFFEAVPVLRSGIVHGILCEAAIITAGNFGRPEKLPGSKRRLMALMAPPCGIGFLVPSLSPSSSPCVTLSLLPEGLDKPAENLSHLI